MSQVIFTSSESECSLRKCYSSHLWICTTMFQPRRYWFCRWYFDNPYDSQFAPNGTATVGFGDAVFTLNGASNLPPTVLVAPQNAQALLGGRAAFAVSAIGASAPGKSTPLKRH